jgi:hypothetical protein
VGNLQGLDNGVKMQPVFNEVDTPFGYKIEAMAPVTQMQLS